MIKLIQSYFRKHYGSFIFTRDNQSSFSYYDQKNLGLYIHIPFCKSICYFCPFCKEVYTKERMAQYIKALLIEVDLICKNSNIKSVESVYIGGGTPALAIDYLDSIVDKLREYFIFSELGIELRPRDLTDEILSKLKQCKVNMISIGIQSFKDNLLQKLDRESLDQERLKSMLDKYEFETVSFDLIFAIEGQTEKDLREDFNVSFALGATQVSTYPFIEFSYLSQVNSASKELKKRLLNSLVDHANGYQRIGVWSFVKPGSKKYSSITRDNFVGFGASATSLNQESFKVNTFSVDKYISRINEGVLPSEVRLDFTLKQRVLYYLFWAVYGLEVDFTKVRELFDFSIKQQFSRELKLAKLFGLIEIEQDLIKLTNRGAYVYHLIEQAYTNTMIDKLWGILSSDDIPDQIELK